MADFVDPYVDPATGILRNLVAATTQEALDQIEADLVEARTVDLPKQPIKRTSDLTELRAIHRYLFADVYDWAGQLRTVDIRKNVEGSEYFVPVSLIERAAGFAAGELAEDNFLRGMDRDTFIARLAHHYDQLNYIHPFREGNGRTQRAFWDRVARNAGWQLTWLSVTGEVNDRASRVASETQDLGPLIAIFHEIVGPLT
ncbi:Fic/DOC family protein [Nocardioides sp.]|uniref:Fic/DOC family protein n=1 Tax=Nocardioides sp. TaxID=35761 RepID=UPI0039E61114